MMYEGFASFRARHVLIADPQPVFRLGLVSMLESAHPAWDIAEADTLDEHRSRLRARAIDLLIIDARRPGGDLANQQQASPRVNLARTVIAVTEPGDTISALGCLSAGAHDT